MAPEQSRRTTRKRKGAAPLDRTKAQVAYGPQERAGRQQSRQTAALGSGR
jgi:hypothetical protein